MDSPLNPRWSLPPGQRLVFEDFDDGVILFDARVGSTHLLNGISAEALAIVLESPGLATLDVHDRLLARLDIDSDVLPVEIVDELLWRLEDLNLVAVDPS